MTRDELLAEIARMVQVDPSALRVDMRLSAIQGWDSLAIMSFIALIHSECAIVLKVGDLAACTTVADLVALAAGKPSG